MPTAHEVDELLRRLRSLGFDLAEWRDVKTEGALERRAQIREDIRNAVNHGHDELGLTYAEMAEELGISRQHLDNIRREDPTGRKRG